MSTEKLRERAQGWANRLAVYFELSGKDKCDTAQLLRDLCAALEEKDSQIENLRYELRGAGEEIDYQAKKCKRLDKALQSLTPMGSEFVNAPERCVEYVLDVRRRQLEYIKKQKRELSRLEKENGALREAAQHVVDYEAEDFEELRYALRGEGGLDHSHRKIDRAR